MIRLIPHLDWPTMAGFLLNCISTCCTRQMSGLPNIYLSFKWRNRLFPLVNAWPWGFTRSVSLKEIEAQLKKLAEKDVAAMCCKMFWIDASVKFVGWTFWMFWSVCRMSPKVSVVFVFIGRAQQRESQGCLLSKDGNSNYFWLHMFSWGATTIFATFGAGETFCNRLRGGRLDVI